MKFTIEVDCTPDEARAFLGLPAVAPLQEALLKELKDRMSANMASMDPDALMKLWFPGGQEGWQKVQQSFWDQFAKAAGGGGPGRGGADKR